VVDKAIKNGAFIASECFRHVQHRPTHRCKTAGINARAGYGMRVVHDFASDCGNCREGIFKIENHQDLSTIYYITGTLRWSCDHQHRTRVRYFDQVIKEFAMKRARAHKFGYTTV